MPRHSHGRVVTSNRRMSIRERTTQPAPGRLQAGQPPHAESVEETARPLRPTRRRTLLAWLLVAAFLVAGYFGIKLLGASRKRPATVSKVTEAQSVSVASAGRRTLQDRLQATGSIYAVDPIQVGAELNGLRVTSVNVEEGDFVEKGQVLARLNDSVLRAQLHQAQAQQSSASAQVSKAAQPNRPQDINGLRAAEAQARATVTQEEANLRQAEVNLNTAETTWQRYQQVLAQGFVTVQEASERQAEVDRNRQLVQAARQRVQAARYAAEQARQRVLLAEAGGRNEDVQIARAGYEQFGGLIEQLQAQLEQTVIRAPESGLVTRREVQLGEISSAGKAFFTLARKGELELRAEVPQDDLLRLKVGMPARVMFSQRATTGKVWQISPEINPTTRLGVARIKIDAKSGARPGMFAQARLDVGQHRGLTVPFVAVQGEGGEFFVFRVMNGKAERVRVRTGIRTNQFVEILEGLREGDVIVVNGAGFLRNGDPVQIRS